MIRQKREVLLSTPTTIQRPDTVRVHPIDKDSSAKHGAKIEIHKIVNMVHCVKSLFAYLLFA